MTKSRKKLWRQFLAFQVWNFNIQLYASSFLYREGGFELGCLGLQRLSSANWASTLWPKPNYMHFLCLENKWYSIMNHLGWFYLLFFRGWISLCGHERPENDINWRHRPCPCGGKAEETVSCWNSFSWAS